MLSLNSEPCERNKITRQAFLYFPAHSVHNVNMLHSINRRSINLDCITKRNYINFMDSFALCPLLFHCTSETYYSTSTQSPEDFILLNGENK